MAGKSKSEVVLKFDWIELGGYLGPSFLVLLRAWTLYNLRSCLPYFFLIYAIFPIIEIYAPKYMKNHTENEQRVREKDDRFLIPLYTFFVAHWIETYFVFDFMNYAFSNFSYLKIVLTILVIWISSGEDLVVGHELGHRKNWIHRAFGYLMYLRFLNTNFIITHNKGHHKWVATPLDPASARQGQTVFEFAAHSLPHSVVQGWNIEVERIEKLHGPEVSIFYKVFLNQVFLMKLGEVVYLAGVWYLFNFKVMCFAVVLGLLLQCTLEIINYVEHYGLRRKEIAPGKYERVNVSHSWNSSHTLANSLEFRLPRHSDHHETGSKPY